MNVLDEALLFLFENEGSVYTNDPMDSGGPTKFGVTLKAYSLFVQREVSPSEIEKITLDDVKPFYRERYWDRLRCGEITEPMIAIAIFDTGVLYGIGPSAMFAQQALSLCGASLKIDGVIGTKTIALLNMVSREHFLESFRKFVLHRIEMIVRASPKNERFRQGWENRADRLLTLNCENPFNSKISKA